MSSHELFRFLNRTLLRRRADQFLHFGVRFPGFVAAVEVTVGREAEVHNSTRQIGPASAVELWRGSARLDVLEDGVDFVGL